MAAHETSNSGNKAAGSDVAALAAATLTVRIDDGVAVVALARPEVHNAFDEVLIAELTATLKALDADAAVRVVVLAGQGRSFCAGADLGWMQRMAGYSHAENLADAGALAAMLATLDRMGKPTIARVHGAAYGVFARGMQWQGLSLWLTLRYGPAPWVPSSFMPTLPGRLFFHQGLAGPLVPEMN